MENDCDFGVVRIGEDHEREAEAFAIAELLRNARIAWREYTGWQRDRIKVDYPCTFGDAFGTRSGPAWTTRNDLICLSHDHKGNIDTGPILHEYGHAIMFTAYGGFGGYTSEEETAATQGEGKEWVAMAEGWAEFVQAVLIQGIRSKADGVFECPPLDAKTEKYTFDSTIGNNAGHIATVQAVLWDLFDANKEMLLDKDDVLDYQALCTKIRQSGASAWQPRARVWEMLPAETQQDVRLWSEGAAMSDSDSTSLVKALNAVLGRPDFYDSVAFGGFVLPYEAEALVARGPSELPTTGLHRLNRLLLVTMFPDQVRAGDDPAPGWGECANMEDWDDVCDRQQIWKIITHNKPLTARVFLRRWPNKPAIRKVFQDHGLLSPWVVMESNTDAMLAAVWAFEKDRVVAVGADNTVAVLAGQNWLARQAPYDRKCQLKSVWGPDFHRVYITGSGSRAWRLDADALRRKPPNRAAEAFDDLIGEKPEWHLTPAFNAVWGYSDTEIYFAGSAGRYYRYDYLARKWHWQADDWRGRTLTHGPAILDIFALDSGNIFVTTSRGQVFQYHFHPGFDHGEVDEGEYIRSWRVVANSPGNTAPLNAVWAASPDEVYAVGGRGLVLKSNKAGWGRQTLQYGRPRLQGVWANKPGDAFVVGSDGFIARHDGSNWTVMSTPTDQNLLDVHGVADQVVYAVGENGTIIKLDIRPTRNVTGQMLVKGEPKMGAKLVLAQEGKPDKSATTDAQGRYQFLNVLAGAPYTIKEQ